MLRLYGAGIAAVWFPESCAEMMAEEPRTLIPLLTISRVGVQYDSPGGPTPWKGMLTFDYGKVYFEPRPKTPIG